MFKVPKGVYLVLLFSALVVVAMKMALVGRVTWLPKGGNGEAYVDFMLCFFTLAGFGSAMKSGVQVETESESVTVTTTKTTEPAPLPPPPKAGEQ